MTSDFKFCAINNKTICVGGLGKLFYQDGFPIQIGIDLLKEKGIEVSLLHIADELYKHGWEERAILGAFQTDTGKDFDEIEKIKEFIKIGHTNELEIDSRDKTKLPSNYQFIYSSGGYEAQREMLFESLFNYSSNNAKEKIIQNPKNNEFITFIENNFILDNQ